MTAARSGHDDIVPLLLGMEWNDDVPGGLNRYLADLLGALRANGLNARATVVGPATTAPFGVDAPGSPADPLPVRLWRLRASAARWRPDVHVVDAHFALHAFLPVVLGTLRGKPLVVHFQGPWADESVVTEGDNRAVVAVKRGIERAVYRRAKGVVTLSAAFKRVVVERYGVTPWLVRVIPPGIDLDGFQPSDKAEARKRLGLGEHDPVAVAVRRFDPRMGLDVLVEAWADVSAALPGARLLFVGDGPLRPAIQELAERRGIEGSVRFLGSVDHETLVASYRAADVSVVPTTALEGFGLVVLESLACGTPVVVTDAGGLPEAIGDFDPQAIVPAGDADALAGALQRSLTDGAARPSPSRCRVHAEAHGWRPVARRHAEIYREVRSPPGSRRLRVVYLDHTAQLSGGELALLTLLPALDQVDAHVVLGEDGPLVSRLTREGLSVEVRPLHEGARSLPKDRVRVGRLPFASLLHTAVHVARLARRLRRLRPDIVHANSLKSGLYGGFAARLAGVPVVWHIRDRIAPDYLPGQAVRIVRALAARLPSRVVANSRTTFDTLGPARGRAAVIPSPVRLADADGHPRPPRPGPLCFGVIGRLSPWKGQHLFLAAFARAFPEGPERARIVGGALFGEDAYAQDLKDQVAALGLDGRVELRGFREDVGSELDELDVVVHSSVSPEPFGQVVVEAMWAGTPVVAAAGGGPAEVIEDGVDGLLYPIGDVDALAERMRRLAGDPELRRALARAGRRRAADFEVHKVAEAVMAVYRSVAGPSDER